MTYDVKQFRVSIYLLVLLGIAGYALAAQSPWILLLGVAGVLANAWLVRIGKFKSLPRPLANLITLTSVVYIVHEVMTAGGTPVMIVGQFLVFLQLVKLWEQRGNRDWGQLLILSLLLIVAASMNTASLLFGIVFAGYLFLSLYCCLLFHLKVEADEAAEAMPVPARDLGPGTLRQDQRYLGRSMRKLTATVAVVGIAFAVAVFLVFPRGPVGIGGPAKFPGDNPLTGFSDHVSFQSVARITQSHERVAFAKVFHNDQLVQGTETLLMRGLTLDTYTPPPHEGGSWDWSGTNAQYRGRRAARPDAFQRVRDNGEIGFGGLGKDQWRQEVTLWPTNTSVIFALPGPRRVNAHPPQAMLYAPADGTLQSNRPPRDRIEYEVISANSPQSGLGWRGPDAVQLRTRFSRIYAFARLPEVCGIDLQGRNLADLRLTQNGVTPLDAQIAANIERYLRKHFTYTLDLTDAQQIRGQDPLESFLYEWRRGHCEYFAGAMTLMCQTLGMQARMVIGFKAVPSNYNDFTQSYAIYDSDAHAWVEVKTAKGWEAFDPTSSRTDERPLAGLVPKIRHFMEYLEFQYANAVIAYDAQSRASVIVATESAMSGLLLSAENWVGGMGNWMAHPSEFGLGLVFAGLGALLALSVGWFVWERWRLLRRAQRIGIESLPEAQQLKLARQLGFYDDLMRMLEARRILRAAHQTPLEFGRSLAFLPPAIYDTILRLTRLFYQVRYGGAELTVWRRRRLENALSKLGHQLEIAVERRGA
jgi:transglutaminase-like putative cysteine protease